MITTEQLYQHYLDHPVISTDTRKIIPGSIFFALKGENFNANTFAQQAVESGAAYAVIDEGEYQLDERYLMVDDVLTALQDLARVHRRHLSIPVIGLTGSNGKTTTKELISAVLSQKFNTLATQGNLNNHIGVPLTVLSITAAHQMAVIEMGANHQKEIELLCSIAQPNYGLITNVGKAHLEGFGGVEGVKKGKGELYDYLEQTDGIAFINHNDKVLMEMQAARQLKNIVFYGNGQSLISGKLLANAPYLSVSWKNNNTGETYRINSQLTGEYNLNNMLAAICIGAYFNLSADEINAGIEGYQPKNNRSQLVQTATNTLVCDYYNANPSSMAVAIDNLGRLEAKHKVLILGDMFELGEDAPAEHRSVIQKALLAKADKRIFVGDIFYQQKADIKADFYRTAEEAIAALKAKAIKNSTILIKGSRGMALERLAGLL